MRKRTRPAGRLVAAWGILLLGGCVSSVAHRSVRPLHAGQWGGGISVWYPVMMSGYLRGAFADWLEVEAVANVPDPTIESGFRLHLARSDRAVLTLAARGFVGASDLFGDVETFGTGGVWDARRGRQSVPWGFAGWTAACVVGLVSPIDWIWFGIGLEAGWAEAFAGPGVDPPDLDPPVPAVGLFLSLEFVSDDDSFSVGARFPLLAHPADDVFAFAKAFALAGFGFGGNFYSEAG